MANNVLPDPLNVRLPEPLEVVSTNTSDFDSNVSLGLVEGYDMVIVQGENLDVDVANRENLWPVGGTLVYPVTGEQWEVRSSDANDSATGTGARSVLITYLDDNYIEQELEVALNGSSPVVAGATDMFRLQKFSVATVGSSGFNQGNITVRVAGNGDDRGRILEGENNSLHGFFTVPAGKSAFIVYGNASCKKNDEAVIDFYMTSGTDGVFRRNKFADLFGNTTYIQPRYPLGPIIEKSDIQFLAKSFNTNNEASAFLQLLIVDNEA